MPAQTPPTADAVADSVRVAIDAATAATDVAGLEAALALVDRGLALYPNAPLLTHYKAYALYRAATLNFGREDNDRAKRQLETARDLLEPLAKRETIPETYAVLSSVYGMLIGVSKVPMVAGMRLGPKATEWIDRAVEAGPRNPRVWVMKGIGAINTPAMFGGGLDKAEAHLKKALALFADDHPPAPLPAWGRADAHIWLGQVYAKQKRSDLARAEYEAALALQPGNQWVRMGLLPSVTKK